MAWRIENFSFHGEKCQVGRDEGILPFNRTSKGAPNDIALSDQKYNRYRYYHDQPKQGGFSLLIADHDAGAGIESGTEGGGGRDKLLNPNRQVEKPIVIQQNIGAEEIVPIRGEIDEG